MIRNSKDKNPIKEQLLRKDTQTITDTSNAVANLSELSENYPRYKAAPITPQVMLTAFLSAFKNTLSILVFGLYIADEKNLSLPTSLMMIGIGWPVIFAFNLWSELNQIKGRLNKTYHFEILPDNDSTALAQNTLYFFQDENNNYELKYSIIIPKEIDLENQTTEVDQETEECKTEERKTASLEEALKKSDITQKIKKKIETAITHHTELSFDSAEIKELERVTKEHGYKPKQEIDLTPVPGETLDWGYVFKILGASVPTSIINAVLLDLAVMQGGSTMAIVGVGAVLSTLNLLQTWYDIYQTYNEHAAAFNERAEIKKIAQMQAMSDAFMNSNAGKSVTAHYIKAINAHFPFAFLSHQTLLTLLRELAPVICAGLNAGSFFSIVNTVSNHPAWTAFSYGISFWLFMNTISSMVHYNLSVIKQILERTQVNFNIESCFSRAEWKSNTALDSFLQRGSHVLGGLLSANYLVVELPAKYGISPERIAIMALFSYGVGSIALVFEALKKYVICYNNECFQEGNGLILRSIVGAKTLDNVAKSVAVNPLAVAFGTMIIMMIIAAYFTMLSKYAVFAESAKEHLNNKPSWKKDEVNNEEQGDLSFFEAVCRVIMRALYFKNPFASEEKIKEEVEGIRQSLPYVRETLFTRVGVSGNEQQLQQLQNSILQ